jgi:hypothetical protein
VLVTGIHLSACSELADGWIPATSAGMTIVSYGITLYR